MCSLVALHHRVLLWVKSYMRRLQKPSFLWSYRQLSALELSFGLLTLCLALLIGSPSFSQVVSGRPDVVDGDTLIIGEVRIRLNAVDAPETDQTCLDPKGSAFACGIVARDRLRTKIDNTPVTCVSEGQDKYGRTIATCKLGNEDLNRWLVSEGLALAYVQYSDRYANVEETARTKENGFWAGAFIAPWDWRHRTPNTQLRGALAYKGNHASLGSIRPASPPVAECAIKGNVNRKGERIYFLPGNSAYGKVRMDKGMGERWFCAEDEAVAAGWRKALNTR